MIAHLPDRADALVRVGWTRREAEWLALVRLQRRVPSLAVPRLHGRTNLAFANRFPPVPQARHRTALEWYCRIAARRIHRTLGAEHAAEHGCRRSFTGLGG